MPRVNPNILRWARETAGFSEEEAVRKLQIKGTRGVDPLNRLAALESGDVAPTRPMLVKMSNQYHRPILTFYFSEPPRTGDIGEDFRTLPTTLAVTDRALVDVVLRDIRARQSLVRNVLEEEDEADPLPFIGTASVQDDPTALAHKIVETLSFELATYISSKTKDAAVNYLRAQAEASGVFVLFVDNLGSHHTEISVEVFRGFALADKIAPFVAVNANDSKGAHAFTIVHELTHLWLGVTGVSGQVADRTIEKFCNDVAGEFLLPAAELQAIALDQNIGLDQAVKIIRGFANARNLSGTMVAYLLHRQGAFSYEMYSQIAGIFRSNFNDQRQRTRDQNRDAGGGPPYPVIKRHRAGPALVKLVDRMMRAGALTTTKAGRVLGVSGKNVHGVIRAGGPNQAT